MKEREELKGADDGVFAHGEVTGHAHRTRDAKVYGDKEGYRYTKSEEKDISITHEEHSTTTLRKGVAWAAGQINEWDSFEQEARRVRD